MNKLPRFFIPAFQCADCGIILLVEPETIPFGDTLRVTHGDFSNCYSDICTQHGKSFLVKLQFVEAIEIKQ